MTKKENKKLLNEKDTDKVSGGFSHSSSYDKTEGWESSYESFSLTEAEREKLRSTGAKFELNDFGEISAVVDKTGKKLTPKDIGSILYENK